MVRNGASSHKIDYIIGESNLEGHQNRTAGSGVTAILLNGLIFSIGQSGEASWWRVCYQGGLLRLVFRSIQTIKNIAYSWSHSVTN